MTRYYVYSYWIDKHLFYNILEWDKDREPGKEDFDFWVIDGPYSEDQALDKLYFDVYGKYPEYEP